jgi:uncharacterized protein
MHAIKRLLEEKISMGIIITVHKKNGLPKYRERFKDWIRELISWGVHGARLHTLEVDHSSVGETLALTPEQNVEFVLDMWEFELAELDRKFTFDLFRDINLIQHKDDTNTTCTFLACDPYTTHAVQGIDSQGNQSNCGRANKDGINWIKAQYDGFERQMALYHTPEEHGGCQGCRFFIMCKGHCPGTGLDMEWRSKTDSCLTWKILFSIAEKTMLKRGETPLSLDPNLKKYEEIMLYGFSRGVELRLFNITKHLKNEFDVEKYINKILQEMKTGGHLTHLHGNHTDDTGEHRKTMYEEYGITL